MVVVKDWWNKIVLTRSPSRKGLGSLLMLVFWELCKRNARVFSNNSTPSVIIVDRILEEARLWVTMSVKGFDVILPRG